MEESIPEKPDQAHCRELQDAKNGMNADDYVLRKYYDDNGRLIETRKVGKL